MFLLSQGLQVLDCALLTLPITLSWLESSAHHPHPLSDVSGAHLREEGPPPGTARPTGQNCLPGSKHCFRLNGLYTFSGFPDRIEEATAITLMGKFSYERNSNLRWNGHLTASNLLPIRQFSLQGFRRPCAQSLLLLTTSLLTFHQLHESCLLFNCPILAFFCGSKSFLYAF